MVQGHLDTPPKVLTTGQVARICNVAPRTVSKWFDMGQLRGYRIPGSRDRRVPLDQLVRFMKAHNMPLNGLDAGPRRVLLVQSDSDLSRTISQRLALAGFEVHLAGTAFEAGLLAERVRPHVVVLDMASADLQPSTVAAAVRREPQMMDVKLLALDADGRQADAVPLPRRGFDARLTDACNIPKLVDALNGLLQ